MRKIEKRMVWHVYRGVPMVSGNTSVVCKPAGARHANIYLHGNHIARYDRCAERVDVDRETLRRWPTATTKSRLRALGADVTTRKGVTYLDGEPV